MSIRSITPTSLGGSVIIYCDLLDSSESLANLVWRRYNYNGSNILNLLGANVPARYSISNNQVNGSYAISSLSISGVISDDFSTFECISSGTDKKNLTQLSNCYNILVKDILGN